MHDTYDDECMDRTTISKVDKAAGLATLRALPPGVAITVVPDSPLADFEETEVLPGMALDDPEAIVVRARGGARFGLARGGTFFGRSLACLPDSFNTVLVASAPCRVS